MTCEIPVPAMITRWEIEEQYPNHRFLLPNDREMPNPPVWCWGLPKGARWGGSPSNEFGDMAYGYWFPCECGKEHFTGIGIILTPKAQRTTD